MVVNLVIGKQMLRHIALTSAAFSTVAFAPIAHATEEDLNAWAAQTANINLGGDVVVWLEAQERFTNDASRLGQLLIRPAIGYKLDASTTAYLGYAYVLTEPVGAAATNEHRIFQQLSFRLMGDGSTVTLTGRTRLEQRFLEERDGTGLRLRQQVRLTAPVAEGVRAVVWTEPFINLNDTTFQQDGIGIWRNFAGVAVPVAQGFTLEPGYLNQYVRRNGADRIDHTISFTLSASL